MSTIVIVGTYKGVLILRSNPKTGEWDAGEFLFKGWSVTCSARDSGGRYYLGVTHEVYGATIIVSDDLENWRQIEQGPAYDGKSKGNADHMLIARQASDIRQVDQIWKLLCVGERIYAGVSEAGLFYSDDRGETWHGVNGLNAYQGRENWDAGFGGLCVHSLLFDANNAARMWCGISAAGVFRTDDGGDTWQKKNDGVFSPSPGFCVHSLAHDPANADLIYRQDHNGMYLSRNGGDNWSYIQAGLPMGSAQDQPCVFGFICEMDQKSNSVFVLPLEGDSYRFPHDGKLKVFRTRDEGQTWQALSEGLPQQHAFVNILRGAMSVDQQQPCGVYFGTTSGTVYASSNCGDSWNSLVRELPRIQSVEAYPV